MQTNGKNMNVIVRSAKRQTHETSMQIAHLWQTLREAQSYCTLDVTDGFL